MSAPSETAREGDVIESAPSSTVPHIVSTDMDAGRTNAAAPSGSNVSSTTNDQTHLGVPLPSGRTASRTSEASTYVHSEKLGAHSTEPTSPSSDGPETDEEKPSLLRRVFPFLKKKEAFVYQPKPDPSPEEMKPFDTALTPSSLYNLIDPKNVGHLKELGGSEGILKGLGSDRKMGIQSSSTISKDDRLRVYGVNRIPERKSKTLLQLMWAAYQDKVLLVLSVAAVISLALGIYQSTGAPPRTYASTRCPNSLCVEASVEWVEGVAITIAILIVVLVGSVNDYQKERQFRKLNAQKEERNVKAIRDGNEQLMSVYDVLVGDVLIVEPGEIVPVDGVMISGHNIRCDESGATGESDAVKKVPLEELGTEENKKADPFLLSGAKVLEGVGTYVVTSVGESSFHGRIMMSLRDTGEEVTPLQLKLNALAELIAKIGSSAGLILFSALMIRFFVQLGTNPDRTGDEKAQNFIQILIIAVTVVVVAVPEGLPLAVTLALAFATRRMTKMNLLVRVLGACETMANATVICTDKTGTLTTNSMTVVAGSVGVHLKFAARATENQARINANDDVGDEKAEEVDAEPRKGKLDFSTDMAELNRHVNPAVVKLLNDSIAINSTAFAGVDEHGKEGGFVGSKTETALLSFARDQGWADYKEARESAEVVQMIPFSSERKAMGCVVKLPGNAGYRLFLKGASEVLARMSSHHVVVNENGASEHTAVTEVPVAEFNNETRGNINRTIIFYANQSLRTIALCTRDFTSWPPVGARKDDAGEVEWADLARDLTLVAITAIEDPLREGVPEAVRTCQGAGVSVKMCTGDNVLTARSIALQCGIFTPGGIIMEGPAFRKLSDPERIALVPRLQVLARSSPEDKKILVDTLKGLGEIVGVTGDGTNDAPALNTANVGFSMGIAGTEVAKQASDIIIMDDSFKSIVSAIMWGRCVNDSVKKFLQFQISVNITAVIITFVTAVASNEEESVLTAVQLLWVNLIMDTFAALALATDPATPESLKRKPDKKYAPLITPQMWIMIVGQAIFQIIVSLVLHFAGRQILGLHSDDLGVEIDQENELKTLVFNSFVWCQIFNMFNSRRLDRKLNVFTGIWKNWYFLVIFAIMAGGQALIVNVGGAAFQVVRINGRDWAISIIIGLMSLPLAVVIRLLPPGPFVKFMIGSGLVRDPDAPLPTASPQSEETQWNEGINRLINNLNVYSTIRGGRLGSVKFVRAQRRRKAQKAGVQPTSLLAMVPTLVMSSVGAGWRPQGGSLFDPASTDPSKSTMQLVEGAIQAHPDTPEDDPILTRFHATRTPGHSRKVSVASEKTAASPHSPPRL